MTKDTVAEAFNVLFSSSELTEEHFSVIRESIMAGFVLTGIDDQAIKELVKYDGTDYKTKICECANKIILKSYTLRYGEQ